DRDDLIVRHEVREQHRLVVEQLARAVERRGARRLQPRDQRVLIRDRRLDVVESPERIAPALELSLVVLARDDLLVELDDVRLDLALVEREQRRHFYRGRQQIRAASYGSI